jgi:serine/threonine protein kinase
MTSVLLESASVQEPSVACSMGTTVASTHRAVEHTTSPVSPHLFSSSSDTVYSPPITMTSYIGTLMWMAPELMPLDHRGGFLPSARVEYNEAVDTFSVGLILWAIATRREPDAAAYGVGAGLAAANKHRRVRADTDEWFQIREVVRAVASGHRPELPLACPSAWVDLISRCWHGQATMRPTMTEVRDTLARAAAEEPQL